MACGRNKFRHVALRWMAQNSGRKLIQAHPVDRLDGSQMQQVAASKRQRQIILMLSTHHSTRELYDHRTKDIFTLDR